jgi:hypothetical protein
MTDLSGMRDRPIGTPGVGFSMKPAKVDEEGRQLFLEDVRRVINTPMAVGMPGAYLVQSGKLQPSGGYTKMVSELPPGYRALDPMAFGMGALDERSALKAMRRLVKQDTQAMLAAKKYPQSSILATHRLRMGEAKQAAKDVPEWLWGRVEEIVEEVGPTTRGRHTVRASLDPAVREVEIGLNPRHFDYWTVMHEVVGHEGSAALGEAAGKLGLENLRKFKGWWNFTKTEMKSMQALLEKRGLDIEAGRLYKWNPDEIYSNVAAGLVDKGIDPAVASKHAALEVFSRRGQIMHNVKRSLESVRELLEAEGKTLDVDYYLKQYYSR